MPRPFRAPFAVLACAPVLLAAPLASAQAASAEPEPPKSADAPPTPSPRPEDPKRWGDWSIAVVERFGLLLIAGAEPAATSPTVRGAGAELRYVMPVGWGAYWRWTDVASSVQNQFEWRQSELMFGFSRRVFRTGRVDPWTFRSQARVDVGVGFSRVGTNESCSQSFVPFGTSCSTGPGRPPNITGDAAALEVRLSGDVGFGPIGLGLDVGFAAYARYVTGDNSVPPPGLFYLPSAQLRLGVAVPFL